MGADDYLPTDDSTEEPTTDSDESVSYIEISSVDHPEAHALVEDSSVIRSNTDIDALFANVATEVLGPMFESADRTGALEWALTYTDENGEAQIHTDALQKFIDEHVDAQIDFDSE